MIYRYFVRMARQIYWQGRGENSKIEIFFNEKERNVELKERDENRPVEAPHSMLMALSFPTFKCYKPLFTV